MPLVVLVIVLPVRFLNRCNYWDLVSNSVDDAEDGIVSSCLKWLYYLCRAKRNQQANKQKGVYFCH